MESPSFLHTLRKGVPHRETVQVMAMTGSLGPVDYSQDQGLTVSSMQTLHQRGSVPAEH